MDKRSVPGPVLGLEGHVVGRVLGQAQGDKLADVAPDSVLQRWNHW